MTDDSAAPRRSQATTAEGVTDAGDDRPGEAPLLVDRFMIEDELGAGGMGRVYLAYDPSLDRKVALKLIRDEFGGDTEKARARMAREARAMARLSHPNVVAVYEVGKHEGSVFIVMELVTGGTLRSWLEEHPEVTWREIVAKYVLAGKGLAAAHVAGMVHRDFKPDNVLVDGDRVLVTDFGIANVYGEAIESSLASIERARPVHLTRTGAVMGTPPYMSPEQHLGEPADARTDQFSFCVALYEALYGVRPFAGDDHLGIADAAIHGEITPPKIDRDEPAQIRDAIRRGLRAEPADRFPTMASLLAELAPPAPRKPPWLAIVAGVAGAAGLTVWLAARGDEVIPGPVCDCELVTITVPPDGRVVGLAPIVDAAPPVSFPAHGTELLVPRGPIAIVYEVGGARYALALVSRGIEHARTVALPAPESRDGYVFVPGGDVPIGATGGEPNEHPASTIHLEPYLIATREEPALLDHDTATTQALANRNRLPTAAEWEWAARLGVIPGALTNEWEWTATRFGPYPYDPDRDHSPDDGTIEIRGGQRTPCPDAAARRTNPCGNDPPRVTRRFEGRPAGKAEVRFARTPANLILPNEVRLERGGEDGDTFKNIGAVRRLQHALRTRSDHPALQIAVRGGRLDCLTESVFALVHYHNIEVIDDPELPESVVVARRHPDRTFSRERRSVFCTRSAMETYDNLCFINERIDPAASPLIETVAQTLDGNPSIVHLTITSMVAATIANPMAASQRRAELVRARLISLGIDPKRLTARGLGVGVPVAKDVDPRGALLGTQSACGPGDRVEFLQGRL